MPALLGCMELGDAAATEAAVEAALEVGITTFDHADIYRDGAAEAAFGEVLAASPSLRARIQIQTKCGIRRAHGDAPGLYDLRGESIARAVERSLERLRTDHVDVLLLHRPDPLGDPGDIAAALHSLHGQGLVRQFGVSNMSGEQIAHLQARIELPLVANQLEMSLYRRDWVEAGVLVNTPEAAANGFPLGTLEHCVDHGLALQAWGPLAQGRYSGRPQTDAERKTAAAVAALAEAKGTTPETIVLWWLQHHPAAIAPVIGTTNPERIRACRDAVAQRSGLSHEEWYALWVTARGAPLP
jgi:predicted oxidoreductase